MGLSNQERYTKLVYATRALTKKGRELPEEEEVLKELVSKLWPALLRPERNPVYWFLGGTTDKDHVESNSLFDLALLHHKPQEKDDFWSAREEEIQSFAYQKLSAPELLNERGNPLGKIYEILEWTEAAAYALRRYQDEMAKGFREYDDIICQIQGECFDKMTQEPVLLDAWLQSKIIRKLLTWDKDDVVNTWWKNQHLYHSMRLLEYPFQIERKRLLEIYTEVQFKTPRINQRVLFTIELLGPRWHYDHQHKDALALFREHNKKPEVEKIRIKPVESAIQICKQKYEERETRTHNRYRKYCELTGETQPDTPVPKQPKQNKPVRKKTRRTPPNPAKKPSTVKKPASSKKSRKS